MEKPETRELRKARPGEINADPVDRYTLVHFAIGLAYAFLGLSWGAAAVLGVLWEVLENPLKKSVPWLFPHATADTLSNSLCDWIAVMGGWALGHAVFTAIQ